MAALEPLNISKRAAYNYNKYNKYSGGHHVPIAFGTGF